MGWMLLVTAVFLFIVRNFKGKKERNQITLKDSLIIGLFQMIAVIPGISRSGATLVGGMFQGLKRSVAFTFSFILYIPISVATLAIGIKDLRHIGFSEWILYIVRLNYGIYIYNDIHKVV